MPAQIFDGLLEVLSQFDSFAQKHRVYCKQKEQQLNLKQQLQVV
jgi:cell shape-determining protein MreC